MKHRNAIKKKKKTVREKTQRHNSEHENQWWPSRHDSKAAFCEHCHRLASAKIAPALTVNPEGRLLFAELNVVFPTFPKTAALDLLEYDTELCLNIQMV